MNFTDAIVTRKNIKRAAWDDEMINIYLRFTESGKYKMVIEHLKGKTEEHDYKLDVSDMIADDWVILT